MPPRVRPELSDLERQILRAALLLEESDIEVRPITIARYLWPRFRVRQDRPRYVKLINALERLERLDYLVRSDLVRRKFMFSSTPKATDLDLSP